MDDMDEDELAFLALRTDEAERMRSGPEPKKNVWEKNPGAAAIGTIGAMLTAAGEDDD